MLSKLARIRHECQQRIYYVLLLVACVLAIATISNLLFQRRHRIYSTERSYNRISLDLNQIVEVPLDDVLDESRPRDPNCSIWTCVNPYRCGHDHITVYVYPLQEYIDTVTGQEAAPLSNEFYHILDTIVHSPYYTPNPNEACLFVPSIDLLNQNRLNVSLVNRALASLEHWDNGQNHILINMLAGVHPTYNTVMDVNTDQAIILGAGFDSWSYRVGFDVSIPVWSPLLRDKANIMLDGTTSSFPDATEHEHEYLLIISQLNILPNHLDLLKSLAEVHHDILFTVQCTENSLDRCTTDSTRKRFHYPQLLSRGTFCLIGPSVRLGQPDLLEIMSSHCIPVIAVDNYILPFEDAIDWTLASVRLREMELATDLVPRLRAITKQSITEMRHQGQLLYTTYFSSLSVMTLNILHYLQCRLFPHSDCTRKQWNQLHDTMASLRNPLFYSRVVSRSEGFTAVILTYDRVDSLFLLIEKLSSVPSLHSILVVWNNQQKPPPILSAFPVIPRPIKIIQTRDNLLSNRFFPYKEIETEAILSIDDDINMLTADEVDFGFEVWREFSDRIVGFPSRLHVWENLTGHWRYESEWTNQISMVLTGAAFHHKYWNHMYTYRMPAIIRKLVDGRMNCEDIAMNFLVANITGKPPVKVTPRKKFKCPECTNNEMLSADLNHMRERSRCIDEFTHIYGRMPLRIVEFRADPVLFKDNFPEKLKRFSDMGTL